MYLEIKTGAVLPGAGQFSGFGLSRPGGFHECR